MQATDPTSLVLRDRFQLISQRLADLVVFGHRLLGRLRVGCGAGWARGDGNGSLLVAKRTVHNDVVARNARLALTPHGVRFDRREDKTVLLGEP
jgi:hypothetical protein